MEETKTSIPDSWDSKVCGHLKVQDRRAKGTGTASAEHPSEATHMVAMFDGLILWGRPMWVMMDSDCIWRLPDRGQCGVITALGPKEFAVGSGPGGEPISIFQKRRDSRVEACTWGEVLDCCCNTEYRWEAGPKLKEALMEAGNWETPVW